VFFVVVKIPEGSKKVKNKVEIIDAEQMAHVMNKKTKRFIFELPAMKNRFWRQIKAGNTVSFLIQINRVPPFSASEVQY
jgi:hypothetical protein